MATSKIIVKNGKFDIDPTNGCANPYFKSLNADATKYVGNGWEVEIRNGRIICHAERIYSDGSHVCHREFRLKDGTLGLAGGNIDRRYAYFREADFQKFLSTCGITQVRKADPSGMTFEPSCEPPPASNYTNLGGVVTSTLVECHYGAKTIPEGSKWALVWEKSEKAMTGGKRHCELVTLERISEGLRAEVRDVLSDLGVKSVWEIKRGVRKDRNA